MADTLECIEREGYFEWRYRDFYAVEVIGNDALPLGLWSRACALPGVEFSDVGRLGECDYLMAFSTQIPANLKIVQAKVTTSISSSGLYPGRERVRGLVDHVVSKSGLVRCQPTRDFIRNITKEKRENDIPAYLEIERNARENDAPLELVFGRAYYGYFLMKHKGLSEEEARATVDRVFE